MKRQYIQLLVLVFVLSFPILASAQDGSDLNDPNVPVPIDGGLGFLLAVGAGYGLKKYREAKKKADEVE